MSLVIDDPTLEVAAALLQACRERGLRLAMAESCTGGLISAVLTSVPGSSDVLERSFVTYANLAKTEMLGVPDSLLAAVGAVSEPVARAMAEGALAHSRGDLAGAVTGIAGPGGGTPAKPVGLVHMAAARLGVPTRHASRVFAGTRDEVRLQAAAMVLVMLREQAEVIS